MNFAVGLTSCLVFPYHHSLSFMFLLHHCLSPSRCLHCATSFSVTGAQGSYVTGGQSYVAAGGSQARGSGALEYGSGSYQYDSLAPQGSNRAFAYGNQGSFNSGNTARI